MKIAHWDKNSPCWIWPGYKNANGYGYTTRNGELFAHRAIYKLFIGSIPVGLCVLHRCDIPACVNPAHLWLGTHADNNKDRALKGRSTKHRRPKTHCKRGHEFTPDTTYYRNIVLKSGVVSVRRDCKLCRNNCAKQFHLHSKERRVHELC